MTNCIIIGGGAAGLAVGACLTRINIAPQIYDESQEIGASWAKHYDRLALHTIKHRSNLPYLKMPKNYPKYPLRDQVTQYLKAYAKTFQLEPILNTRVQKVTRKGNLWHVFHGHGQAFADVVVFATGVNHEPKLPKIKGLDQFEGQFLHSCIFKRAIDYKLDNQAEQRALVIGFGNSGGDIAIDFAEAGFVTDIVVRGAVNILPKELFGIPITSFSFLRKALGPALADRITAPILRQAIGRPQDYGLEALPYGPNVQAVKYGRIPLIDVGVLPLLQNKLIGIRPEIKSISRKTITFTDGISADYDIIIAATGYHVDLRPIMPEFPHLFNDEGRPLDSGGPTKEAGLYFCSYYPSASGQLRQMSLEAKAIAKDIRARFLSV